MVVKELTKVLVLFLLCVGINTQAKAYAPLWSYGVDTSKVGEQRLDVFGVAVEEGSAEKASIERPRIARAVPKGYNGFMIQIIECFNQPLSTEHEIFDRYGKIRMQRVNGDTYRYFICESDRIANIEDVFLKSIKPLYSGAKIVRFDNGVIAETARQ